VGQFGGAFCPFQSLYQIARHGAIETPLVCISPFPIHQVCCLLLTEHNTTAADEQIFSVYVDIFVPVPFLFLSIEFGHCRISEGKGGVQSYEGETGRSRTKSENCQE
jgi:hypothetical protein